MPSKAELLKEKQQLIDELELLNAEMRKDKARSNFVDFCEYVIKDESTGQGIKLAELQKTWIRHIAFCKKHKLNCLILAPMASGKCVSRDTTFITKEKGVVEASNLSVGDLVLSYDEDDECQTWKPVVAVEQQRPSPCVKVTTNNGRQITVTANHRFLTTDGWVEAQDLVPKKSSILGPVSWYSSSKIPSYTHRYAYSIGACFGRANSQHQAECRENVLLIAETYEDVCHRSLQIPRYKNAFAYRQSVCKKILSKIGKDYKSVVNELLQSHPNLCQSFLAGYFDTCGKLVKKQSVYEFYSKARNVDLLQTLLSYVGINGKKVRQTYLSESVEKSSYAVDCYHYKLVIDKNLPKTLFLLKESYHLNKKYSTAFTRKLLQLKPCTEEDLLIDVVRSTVDVGLEETIAVEVEDTHIHATNGLYSHNTQIIAVALPLYFLGKDPTKRIKMVCLSDKAAKERLGAIRSYITSNEDYKELFPAIRPDKNQEWTRHTIFVERDTIAKDASVDTYGVVSSGIGGRCDLLLVDDIFDQRTAVSQPSSREQIIATFNQVWLSRVEPNGQVVIICTRWHEQDLAGDILADEGKLRQYGVLIQRVSDDMDHINCEVIVPDHLSDDYVEMDENYTGFSSF